MKMLDFHPSIFTCFFPKIYIFPSLTSIKHFKEHTLVAFCHAVCFGVCALIKRTPRNYSHMNITSKREVSRSKKKKSVQCLWIRKVFRFHLQFHFIIQPTFLLLQNQKKAHSNTRTHTHPICIVVHIYCYIQLSSLLRALIASCSVARSLW